MLCTACDTPNDESARYCRVCGTPLGSRQAVAETGATQALAPSAPRCASCGRGNPIGARYCVYCASRLEIIPAAGVALTPAAGVAASTNATGLTLVNVDPLQLMLRGVWFVLAGWWLGLLWTLLAWLFNLTIIGLPVGVMMLNAVPQVMTLQRRRRERQAGTGTRNEEHPFVLRALWFVLIGWWASLLWMLLAWALSATLLLLPIGFWMFDRVPTITTLAQEP
jgi:uncharacterized membrane protein YccF (DUF307 family)